MKWITLILLLPFMAQAQTVVDGFCLPKAELEQRIIKGIDYTPYIVDSNVVLATFSFDAITNGINYGKVIYQIQFEVKDNKFRYTIVEKKHIGNDQFPEGGELKNDESKWVAIHRKHWIAVKNYSNKRIDTEIKVIIGNILSSNTEQW